MRWRGFTLSLLLVALVTALANAASAQQLPWKGGDAAPSLAGVRLGDPRDTIERVLGKPDRSDDFGESEWDLAYDKRGIEVQGSARGASAVLVSKRDSGDLGGFRVGDRATDLVKKWGEPTTGGLGAYVYVLGAWQVAVQEDDRGRIVVIGLSGTQESVAPAAKSLAPPAPGGRPVLKGTLRDGTYASPDGSIQFKLPLPVATDTQVEEDIDKGGMFSVVVSAQSLRLRFGFISMKSPPWKSVEDYAARHQYSGSVSEEWIQSTYGTTLRRSVVLDIPKWKQQTRSGEIVVLYGGWSYEFFYEHDAPTPVIEPNVDGYTSLDQMLRAMFESLDIGVRKGGKH